VLCTIVIVAPLTGLILLATTDSPDPQPWGLVLLIAGLGGPLLAGAVLGGNAIRRGEGWIGLGFFLGFVGVSVDPALGPLWFGPVAGIAIVVAGVLLLLLSGIGFWIIGWKVKVPMWLQLPTFGSPRLYVRGRPDDFDGGDENRDMVIPNALDGHQESQTDPDQTGQSRHGRGRRAKLDS
jgi:hypothetical protein